MKKSLDSRFHPQDIEQIIKHYCKPLASERKRDLLARLDAQRETFIKSHTNQSERSTGNNQGRSR